MRAAYIESFSSHGNVIIGQLPEPSVAENEVCIAVSFAGVNPADAKVAKGLFQTLIPHRFPLILGWEAAGTVHSVGSGVSSFKKGDKVYVYCRKPLLQWGSWAEYVTFPENHGALIPKNLSLLQAAAVPLAGLTAWQALFDKAQLMKGNKVLIHGGGGGVGGFAIQWAKIHGATVITTASSSKSDYVRQLGADEVIDYQKRSFVKQIQQKHPSGVDIVFDVIGGDVYKESFAVLKPKGCIVSIREQPDMDLARKYNVRAEYLFVFPNGKQLQDISGLFEQGLVKPPAVHAVPFEHASQAIQEIQRGHTQGKFVLQIRDS